MRVRGKGFAMDIFTCDQNDCDNLDVTRTCSECADVPEISTNRRAGIAIARAFRAGIEVESFYGVNA